MGGYAQLASIYGDLGVLSQGRNDYETAGLWHARALAMYRDLGDPIGEAGEYRELGIVAYERGELDAAEQLLQRAMSLSISLDLLQGQSLTYHEMAIVARAKREFGQARTLERKCLRIAQASGDLHGSSKSLQHLAMIEEDAGSAEEALKSVIRRIRLFDSGASHPWAGSAGSEMNRLTRQVGIARFERIWRDITGTAISARFEGKHLVALEVLDTEGVRMSK